MTVILKGVNNICSYCLNFLSDLDKICIKDLQIMLLSSHESHENRHSESHIVVSGINVQYG